MTIFNWLDQIFFYKKDWNKFTETEQKVFQSYIINRFLSMNKDYIEIVNYFQKYSVGLLESKEIYKWYCNMLPKKKQWNKYIKGKIVNLLKNGGIKLKIKNKTKEIFYGDQII